MKQLLSSHSISETRQYGLDLMSDRNVPRRYVCEISINEVYRIGIQGRDFGKAYYLLPLGMGDALFFRGRLSVCLSHSCLLYNLKNVQAIFIKTSYKYQSTLDDTQSTYKYQSILDDTQSTRTITLAFILFELFPLDSVTKSCLP